MLYGRSFHQRTFYLKNQNHWRSFKAVSFPRLFFKNLKKRPQNKWNNCSVQLYTQTSPYSTWPLKEHCFNFPWNYFPSEVIVQDSSVIIIIITSLFHVDNHWKYSFLNPFHATDLFVYPLEYEKTSGKLCESTEIYSGPNEISMMELFTKILNYSNIELST